MIRIKHNKATYAMIKSAVEKGIYDIQENPGRGARNLVELGEMFAAGPLQKEFFAMARRELAREDSPYYQLVERIVQNCDPDFLSTFGVNLGYNCWTYGARFIRSVEAEYSFNIPWTFFLEMNTRGAPDLALVESILRQGTDIGVYCYMFHFTQAYPQMDGLMELLERYPGCAFLFLMAPQLIDDDLAQRVARMKTVLITFNLEAEEVDERRAVEILFRHGCVYGGYVHYDTLKNAEDLLAEAYEKSLLLLMFMQRDMKTGEAMEADRKELVRLRSRLVYPVFPVDLFGDIAYLDRNISSEACIAVIGGDGSMIISNFDTGITDSGMNIKEQPLVDILRKTLRKREG